MKNRKNRIIIISGIIIVALAFFVVRFVLYSNKFGKIHFVQCHAYFASPVNSEYPIDLVYFTNKYQKDIFEQIGIERVEFENLHGTYVREIKIQNGDTSDKYKIKTLTLSVSFSKAEKQLIDKVYIYLKDGTKQSFSIGEWVFEISNDKQGDHFRIGEKYPLLTKFFEGYNMSFENKSSVNIEIEKVKIELSDIVFPTLSNNIYVEKNSSLVYTLVPNNAVTKNRIYYIKPKIEYKTEEGNKYVYYPYGVYYGLLNLTNEVIEAEVNKTNN